MLNFDKILQFFPESLHKYKRAILREYLQYLMLQAVFTGEFADKLSFIGGTALHICYGNARFSEDMDFDNFGLTEDDFAELTEEVKNRIKLDGFEVEIRNVFKGAFRCYFKIPKILKNFGLSALEDEKIMLQIDTTAQDYKVPKITYTLNGMGVYQDIAVNPPEVIFSQKLITIMERKRLKGRDLYDVSFLSGICRPDEEYLMTKRGINGKKIHAKILDYLKNKDLSSLTEDVSPFLYEPNGIRRVENFLKDFKKLEF